MSINIEECWNDRFPPINLFSFPPKRNSMDREYIEAPVDMVNHPPHYCNHPSGIECITITEHMNFNLGNALKYIWRADLKADAIEDMKKAVFYINREIAKREGK